MSSSHYVSIARTNNAMAEYIFTIIAVFYFQADPVLLHSDFFLILIISAASWTVEIIFRTACVEPSGHQRGHHRTLSAGGHQKRTPSVKMAVNKSIIGPLFRASFGHLSFLHRAQGSIQGQKILVESFGVMLPSLLDEGSSRAYRSKTTSIYLKACKFLHASGTTKYIEQITK